MSERTQLLLRIGVSAVALLVLLAVGITTAIRDDRDDTPRPLDTPMVTMDSRGEEVVIDLWESNQMSGTIVGQARDGDMVQLLSQEGEACEVQINTGVRGWVRCADSIQGFR